VVSLCVSSCAAQPSHPTSPIESSKLDFNIKQILNSHHEPSNEIIHKYKKVKSNIEKQPLPTAI
jgi:hypothetical protein